MQASDVDGTMDKPPSQRVEQDDTVALLSRSGKLRIGFVTEVPEENPDEEEGKSFQDDTLKPDEVSVDWYPTGLNSVMREEQLIILDRGLMLGEAVKACKNAGHDASNSRIGFIADIQISADLAVLNDRKLVVTDVDLKRAQFITPFAISDSSNYVMFDSWVGSVTKCISQLQLVRAGKFRCVVRDDQNSADLRSRQCVETGSFFDSAQWYVGQEVLVSVTSLQSTQTQWMSLQPAVVKHQPRSISAPHRLLAFTVEKVEPYSLNARWIMTHSTDSLTPPPTRLMGADLQRVVRLDTLQYQSAKMGDRVQLSRPPSSAVRSRSEWLKALRAEIDPSAVSISKRAKAAPEPIAEPPRGLSCSQNAASSRSPLSRRSLHGSQVSVSSQNPASSSIRVSASTRLKRAKARLRKASVPRRRLLTKSDRSDRKRKSDDADRLDSQLPVGQMFVGEVLRTRTRATVLWMNGEMDAGIATRDLYLSDLDLDHHEHIPGSLVVKKERVFHAAREMGLVLSIDVESRIALIRWFHLPCEDADSKGVDLSLTPQDGGVERCSLFTLQLHPMYQGFGLGQLVMRISKSSSDISSLIGQVLTTAIPHGKQVDAHSWGLSLSHFQLVHWFNGVEEYVWPMEMTSVVGDGDDNEGGMSDNGEEEAHAMELGSQHEMNDENDSSWESMSDDAPELDERTADFSCQAGDDGTADCSCQTSDQEMTSFPVGVGSRPHFMSLAVFPSSEATASEFLSSEASSVNHSVDYSKQEREERKMETQNVFLQMPAAASTNSEGEERQMDERSQSLTTVPNCYAEHFYLSGRSSHLGADAAFGASRVFLRAIREEMKLLASALPPGIHVTAFEDRMDLFSCVIVGPANTPFVDVPFCFDVSLPAQYPNEPPSVYYRSYSQEQLNPNLYLTGKVCVSLLGTWSGRGSEQWNVGSNLVQVFVSIQGLILNAEPYFNEAGYESRRTLPEAAEKSRRYNEMALVNSLDYLIQVTRTPPSVFTRFIREHFFASRQKMKNRLNSWLCGAETPGFPLCPISEGCAVMIRHQLDVIDSIGV